MSIPVIDHPIWTTPRLPSDLVDFVTAASLSESVQPLTDRTKYLLNILEATGIRRIQTVASLAALKAIEATEGDVCLVDQAGLFVFVPGDAPLYTALDFAPWWVRTTNPVTVEGRWENVALYSTQLHLGKIEGAVPTLDTDGRLTVSAPNAIVNLAYIGKQAELTATNALAVNLTGSLNLGQIKQNDHVKIDGAIRVLCYSEDTVLFNLRLTSDGNTSTLIDLRSVAYVVGGNPVRQWVPICYTYQAGSDSASNSLSVQMFGSSTANTAAQIYHLRAEVIRP